MPSWASRFWISADRVKSVALRLLITRKRSAQAVGSGVKERNALARGSGTAKYISDSLGQATIEYETQNEGKNSGSGISGGGGSMNRGKSAGSSQQFTGRHLLTPDEVMRLGPERPIVLVKGEYPYQLARLNYLVDAEYVGMADPNPYHS